MEEEEEEEAANISEAGQAQAAGKQRQPWQEMEQEVDSEEARCLSNVQVVENEVEPCVILPGLKHEDVKVNLKQKRVPTRERPHKCEQCGTSFNWKSNLTAHRRLHAGVKPYKHSRGGKSFCHTSKVAGRQRICTGEMLYKCDLCEKGFKRKSNLTAHRRIHTRETFHKCSECDHSFSNSTNLTAHQRTHTEKKLESGTSYASQASSVERKTIHTGGRPYKCSACEHSCSSSTNFIAHWRAHIEKPDCGVSSVPPSDFVGADTTRSVKKHFICSKCQTCFMSALSLGIHQLGHKEEVP
ncbi:zinc finger protein 678-like [Lacerta agilis]|uniref:zinc finger protein 678-like n=1 Tax=Lacerta agilis TaxID=80427 RepID=UPI00141930D6|nr:zinc finger protein 678-like [Lacerta agilis]